MMKIFDKSNNEIIKSIIKFPTIPNREISISDDSDNISMREKPHEDKSSFFYRK